MTLSRGLLKISTSEGKKTMTVSEAIAFWANRPASRLPKSFPGNLPKEIRQGKGLFRRSQIQVPNPFSRVSVWVKDPRETQLLALLRHTNLSMNAIIEQTGLGKTFIYSRKSRWVRDGLIKPREKPAPTYSISQLAPATQIVYKTATELGLKVEFVLGETRPKPYSKQLLIEGKLCKIYRGGLCFSGLGQVTPLFSASFTNRDFFAIVTTTLGCYIFPPSVDDIYRHYYFSSYLHPTSSEGKRKIYTRKHLHALNFNRWDFLRNPS